MFLPLKLLERKLIFLFLYNSVKKAENPTYLQLVAGNR